MIDITCPICDTEDEVIEWETGTCKKCGNEYWMDEECTEDYSMCWTAVYWKNYSISDVVYNGEATPASFTKKLISLVKLYCKRIGV